MHDVIEGVVAMRRSVGLLLSVLVATSLSVPAVSLAADVVTGTSDAVAAQREGDVSQGVVSAADGEDADPVVSGSGEQGSAAATPDAPAEAAATDAAATPAAPARWQAPTTAQADTMRGRLDALAASNRDVLSDGARVVIAPKTVGGLCIGDVATAELVGIKGASPSVWVVSHDARGYVTLTNAATGKVLDVKGGKAVVGTQVQQCVANGTYAQKWIVRKTSSGSYELLSALGEDLLLGYPSSSKGARPALRKASAGSVEWAVSDFAQMRSELDALATKNKSVLPDGTYVFVSSAFDSRMVLEVKDASKKNGGNVQLWSHKATAAQRWVVSHDAQGYVTIANVGSGKVLDVSGGIAAPCTNVWQYTSTANNLAQKWVAVRDGNGITLRSALWGNVALDVYNASLKNGANVEVFTLNGSKAQRFFPVRLATPKVEKCADTIQSGAWFAIGAKGAGNKVVDVWNGSEANGANVQVFSPNNTFAQMFTFEYKDGFYAIRNARSGKVLEVEYGEPVAGTNVVQRASNGGARQLWAVTKNSDGSYGLTNKATGLALEVSGSNIRVSVPASSSTQKFSLSQCKNLLAEGTYTIASHGNRKAVLDVKDGSASEGANVWVFQSNGSFAQKWRVAAVKGKENTYTIESLAAGKLLSVAGNGNVCIKKANGSTAQQWTVGIENGAVKFFSVAYPSKSLDLYGGSTANKTNVQVFASHSGVAQRFFLTKASEVVPNGTYMIKFAASPGFAVDVKGASGSNGANVQVYACNKSGAQKWVVKSKGNGTYSIVNAASGKALAVKGGTASAGANVWQQAPNNTKAQTWKFVYCAGGYKIVSALDSGLVLSATGFVNGKNVQIVSDSGASAQRFVLQKTTYTKPKPKPKLSGNQLAMWRKAQGYSSATRWLVLNDVRNGCKTAVFRGHCGNWELVKYWDCGPGTVYTPTPTGQYTVTGRGYSFGHGYTCYYYTQFYGDYLFHSVLYYQNTFNLKDGTLGRRVSHGCIRLKLGNAKWIYDNIPNGTKVVNY